MWLSTKRPKVVEGIHYDVWEHLVSGHNILKEVQDVWEKERTEGNATVPKSDND